MAVNQYMTSAFAVENVDRFAVRRTEKEPDEALSICEYLRLVLQNYHLAQEPLLKLNGIAARGIEISERELKDAQKEFLDRIKPLMNDGWKLLHIGRMGANAKSSRLPLCAVYDNLYYLPQGEYFSSCPTEGWEFYSDLCPVLINHDAGLLLYAGLRPVCGPNKRHLPFMVKSYGACAVSIFGGIVYTGARHDWMNMEIAPVMMVDYDAMIQGTGFYARNMHQKMPGLLSYFYDFKVSSDDTLESYLRLRRFFGNAMESVLRYGSDCPWLYESLSNGIRWGKPGAYRSLKDFFGVNKVDLKRYLKMPDERQLLFYLIARQYQEISTKESDELFKKVLLISGEENFENGYGDYNRWGHFVGFTEDGRARSGIMIKGRRGRNILFTKALPSYLTFYVNQKLYKYISISKYTRYILDEKHKNQNIILSEIENQLADYNDMLKQILGKNTPYTFPYNITHAHATMVENYNAMFGANENREGYGYGAQCADSDENILKLDKLYHDDLYQYEDAKYMVLRPELPSDIYREGTILCHCVGSYTGRVLAGQTRILFMRKKSKPQDPYVTFELRDNRITQQYGAHDRLTTDEERDFISRWFDSYREKKKEWERKGCPDSLNEKHAEILCRHSLTAEEKKQNLMKELASIRNVDTAALQGI
jgi:hypothetical protein